MSLFPPIIFSPVYTDRDKRVYTFIIHSVIREFQRVLKPFPAFDAHPVSMIEVSTKNITGCDCIGIAIYRTDVIKLVAPSRISLFEINAYSSVITHELAHHVIQEYFGDNSVGNRLGTNLVHYWANLLDTDADSLYTYQKRYWSPSFFARYLLPYLVVTYPNLRMLIDNKDAIVKQLAEYAAPKGRHEYW